MLLEVRHELKVGLVELSSLELEWPIQLSVSLLQNPVKFLILTTLAALSGLELSGELPLRPGNSQRWTYQLM